MWGQDRLPCRRHLLFGIIPTRVGTRRRGCVTACRTWDHPHACGDKTNILARPLITRGSSPRVWGQVSFNKCANLHIRIIPTRVGTRLSKHLVDRTVRDHPHACGDKISAMICVAVLIGSSPRVWGQANGRMDIMCKQRIIPTRVGTSLR